MVYIRKNYPLFVSLIYYFLGVLIVKPFVEMPLNDDWVYALDVVSSVKKARLNFLGIESAWGIPQVYIMSLFAPENNLHVILRFFGILSSFGTIILLYFLVSRISKNKTAILLLLLGVIVFPPFFLVSMSFMTDNLFLCLITLASLLFDLAFEQKSQKKLLFGLVICCIALLQRQFAVLFVIPLSLSAVFLYKKNRKMSITTAAGTVFIILTYFFAKNWWFNNAGIKFEPNLIVNNNLFYRFELICVFLFYAGLISSSVFLSINYFSDKPVIIWNKVFFIKLMLMMGIVYLEMQRIHTNIDAPFNGNLFSAFGIFRENEVLLGTRPTIYPDYFRYFIGSLGLVFFIPLMLSQSRENRLEKIVGFFYELRFGAVTVMFGIVYLYVLILRGIFFDRYYLPFLPALLVLASMLINQFKVKKTPVLGFLILSLIFVFTTTQSIDYFKWNEARWNLADGLKNQGVSVNDIDGGYEWNGWNGKIMNAPPLSAVSTAKYFVSFSAVNNFRVVRTVGWYSIWPPHHRTIYLLQIPKVK